MLGRLHTGKDKTFAESNKIKRHYFKVAGINRVLMGVNFKNRFSFLPLFMIQQLPFAYFSVTPHVVNKSFFSIRPYQSHALFPLLLP